MDDACKLVAVGLRTITSATAVIRFNCIGSQSNFLFEHDPFRKPVPTFRDHALWRRRRRSSFRDLVRRDFDKVLLGNNDRISGPVVARD
jgi:hypothetical protein